MSKKKPYSIAKIGTNTFGLIKNKKILRTSSKAGLKTLNRLRKNFNN